MPHYGLDLLPRLGPNPEQQARLDAEGMEAVDRLVQAILERKSAMHYKNGREAKIGDKVMIVDGYNAPCVGIFYDATAGNDFCNGKLALISPNNPQSNLKECLHWDDVKDKLS